MPDYVFPTVASECRRLHADITDITLHSDQDGYPATERLVIRYKGTDHSGVRRALSEAWRIAAPAFYAMPPVDWVCEP